MALRVVRVSVVWEPCFGVEAVTHFEHFKDLRSLGLLVFRISRSACVGCLHKLKSSNPKP